MSAGVEGPEKRKRRMREKKKKEIRTQSSSFPYITSLALYNLQFACKTSHLRAS